MNWKYRIENLQKRVFLCLNSPILSNPPKNDIYLKWYHTRKIQNQKWFLQIFFFRSMPKDYFIYLMIQLSTCVSIIVCFVKSIIFLHAAHAQLSLGTLIRIFCMLFLIQNSRVVFYEKGTFCCIKRALICFYLEYVAWRF